MEVTVLGAGLSGISVADHLVKKGIACRVFESKSHGGGHIYSEQLDGFTWDEGPHVSFTKSEYVKEYFAHNCNREFFEVPTDPSNYYHGSWIPHPAQSNMYALPADLREESIRDVKQVREKLPENYSPGNYQEWLHFAFGKTFADNLPAVYTDKYWTTAPENLATDWIGNRVYFPDITDMVESAKGPLVKQTHYLTQFRYPKNGGFYSYIKQVEKALPIKYNKKLSFISFDNKTLSFTDGSETSYDKVVSTLPLPVLIENSDAPAHIKAAAKKLNCSSVLIINVAVNHCAPIANQWIYVYDKDMYSTRINFTEHLSPNNATAGHSGIQVEVYFSDYRPRTESIEEIEKKVLGELVTMQLIKDSSSILSSHSVWVDWANVIFDLARIETQAQVLDWLSTKGLVREEDDLEPMTEWESKMKTKSKLGDVMLAGRFAQWKYYWTDDCVLRGVYIANNI